MINIAYDDKKTFFRTEIPVLVTHLNPGNHLGYDALLTIIQDGRMNWLKQFGMNEGSIENSVGYVVKELVVDYKSESFHGDKLLVEFYISDIAKTSFIFEYKVTNLTTKKLAALSKSKQIFFDYSTRKVARTPEAFLFIVTSSEKSISIT
jgi:YbgC/YbaW family acyl-CoA thioester hydrolase